MDADSNTYTLARINVAARRIQNRLKRYYPNEIILTCIYYLNSPDVTNIEKMRKYPPWILLLLIKWTALYGEEKSLRHRHLMERDFQYILNLFYEMSGQVRMPSQYENMFLFFRNLAFQQFWLQENYVLARLARQSLLFGHLQDNHFINSNFAALSGTTVSEFIELSLVLMTGIVRENISFVTENWFSTIQPSYGERKISQFLSALSIDYPLLKTYFQQEEPQRRNRLYEFYEQSPLKKYPILKQGERYYSYTNNLLYASLQTYIYDILRDINPNRFMDKFGSIFESYVERGLEYCQLPYISEKVLRQILGQSGKLVDFLVLDEVNIFIDAKGVEIGYLGMVSHLPNVVRDKTRTSIIKGITQGYETASKINDLQQIGKLKIQSDKNYLFIVTFKDMNIGNGTDFYKYIAKEKLDNIIQKEGGTVPIPLENMYFLSIDDFDLFVQHIHGGNSLKEFFNKVIDADKKPETKKLVFRQHLLDLNPNPDFPQYLEDELSVLKENLLINMPN